jgi:hypothetical protein
VRPDEVEKVSKAKTGRKTITSPRREIISGPAATGIPKDAAPFAGRNEHYPSAQNA